jgi:predicted transcriptional regulator
MNLTKSEEQIMEIIWKREKVFLKDIIEDYPAPPPAATTIATLLKRMQDKEFVSYKMFGNSRQYFALVKKDSYFSKHLRALIKNNFNNSAFQFASFFATASNLSASELEDLKKIVDEQIKKKKK